MKTALAVLMVSTLAMTALAWEDRPLGLIHFGIKGDYISFTDNALKDAKVDKSALGGAELYIGIIEGLYIGAEAGYSQNIGTIHVLDTPADNKLTFVPVELNAKYAIALLVNWLVLDVGGGACYSYAKYEVTMEGDSESGTDWMPGGQAFADLNLILGPLYLGVDGKYQLLAKFKDSDMNMNNWRLGGHLGLNF